MKVLVSAASRHGATTEIAERIARSLADAGIEVAVTEPNRVATLEGFDGVVLGSGVYAGRWLEPARRLVDRQREALRARPVWLFSSGPIGDPPKPAAEPPDGLAMRDATMAREHRVIPGRIDKAQLSAERVEVGGEGEVTELGESFNVMAGSLEATERRRLELVGDVAHELRTPLATVDGYLEGLEDGVIDPSSETWTLLRGETARLTRLIDELSELWRAEARQLPLTVETVDLAPVVRAVVERFAPQAEARGIAITLEMGSSLPARIDVDRLAQIGGNYLSNAIRYSPDGGSVRIVMVRSGREIVVAVRDEGAGLTPEQGTRVFERFYRVDPSRSRALGGAGIGLAIARALAAAMDGRTWAESAGPGTGSTFFVAVPAANA